MALIKEYITSLREKKYRITQTREAIISCFCSEKKPLNAADIISLLTKQEKKVNKTTVYREFDFLCAQGIIKPVQIDSTTEHYELAHQRHHHHLVCIGCKKIIDFTPPQDIEDGVRVVIADLERKTGFKIHDHSFELFGRCEECV